MLKKLINRVNVSLSRDKVYDIDLTVYYPLELGVSTEFKGVYTLNGESVPFTCFIKNIEISPFNGQSTTMQYLVNFKENKDILYDQITYFTSEESTVWEYARIRDGKYVTYPEPESYLDTHVKRKSLDNNYFEFKTVEKLLFNGEETHCWVNRREYYSGNTKTRTEKLYLVAGVGVIRYEESNYSDNIELYYQIAEEEIGYNVLKNRYFVYSIYDPREKIISGRFPYGSRTNFKIILSEEDNDPNEALSKADSLFSVISTEEKEEEFRLRLASILVADFIDTSISEDVDNKQIMDVIYLEYALFYTGVMELFYCDGGLFNDRTICVVLDYTGSIISINMKSY
jgi:hypothetical protein